MATKKARETTKKRLVAIYLSEKFNHVTEHHRTSLQLEEVHLAGALLNFYPGHEADGNFSKVQDLETGRVVKEDGSSHFSCLGRDGVCGRTYDSQDSMRRHQKNSCGGIRRFSCVCGKKFTENFKRTQHQKKCVQYQDK